MGTLVGLRDVKATWKEDTACLWGCDCEALPVSSVYFSATLKSSVVV